MGCRHMWTKRRAMCENSCHGCHFSLPLQTAQLSVRTEKNTSIFGLFNSMWPYVASGDISLGARTGQEGNQGMHTSGAFVSGEIEKESNC